MKLTRYLALAILLLGCSHQAKQSSLVAMGERDAELGALHGAVQGVTGDAADKSSLSMVSVQAEQGGVLVAHDISDHQGRYRLGPLKPGTYRVSARFSEARAVHEAIVVLANQATQLDLSLALAPEEGLTSPNQIAGNRGEIAGTVLDKVGGEAFAGSVIALSASHLEDVVLTITDEEGAFRFRGLRPGRYSLSCYYQLVDQGTVELRRGNIEVNAGESTRVTLHMDLTIR